MTASRPALAADPASCSKVRFALVSWTDIQATTGIATSVLKAMGYQTTVTDLSVPLIYEGMKNKDLDVFLGNWMPTMVNDIKPFTDDKSVEVVRANLEGAKYTLAVPAYLYDKGLHDFKDIVKFKKELNGKIYGIEAGNDGNRIILDMIEKNAFGLKGWNLVESSEQAMLSEVERAGKNQKAIVFLGWEPHPMNTQFKMKYLTGGDEYFGKNLGGATIYTNVRAGYTKACPNVGKFLNNLTFSLTQENQIMGAILNEKADPEVAGKAWLSKNPAVLAPMLAGVTTLDGKPALDAVKAALGVK
ncbi:MAG: choline ABC transporter substrate-binding protein [Alphaproteobacteria bacterium]|nr:choline ABC transporter substrate-binding protein [Alphaproteobacteria bacterium]